MKVSFWHSTKPLESQIATAFIAGVNASGDTGSAVPRSTPDLDCDVAVMVGVKSKTLWDKARAAGIKTVLVDRGYLRNPRYFRVSAGAHNPTDFIARARCPHDRLHAWGVKLQPWKSGQHAVLAGSSEKYHEWYGLEHPTLFAQKIANRLAELGQTVTYRPKWSWKAREPVKGAGYDIQRTGLGRTLDRASVLVTHGSNACVEAVIAGVPCVILGDGVARPISSTALEDVTAPRLASDAERSQLLANLAYQQYSLREMSGGAAWRHLRERLDDS